MASSRSWRTFAILAGIVATPIAIGCGGSTPQLKPTSVAHEAVVNKPADDATAADRARQMKAIDQHEAANRAALDKEAADEAAAWDRTVSGTELVLPGITAETAFAAAIATLSWEAPRCAASCPTVNKRASIGKAGELRVVSAPLYKDGPGIGYAVVFGAGARWWSTVPREIESSDCGAGHCVAREILSVSVRQRTDLFQVTFTVREDHYVNVPGAKHDASSSNVVVECTLDAIPRCTDGSAH
jgi:hypothetical protein